MSALDIVDWGVRALLIATTVPKVVYIVKKENSSARKGELVAHGFFAAAQAVTIGLSASGTSMGGTQQLIVDTTVRTVTATSDIARVALDPNTQRLGLGSVIVQDALGLGAGIVGNLSIDSGLEIKESLDVLGYTTGGATTGVMAYKAIKGIRQGEAVTQPDQPPQAQAHVYSQIPQDEAAVQHQDQGERRDSSLFTQGVPAVKDPGLTEVREKHTDPDQSTPPSSPPSSSVLSLGGPLYEERGLEGLEEATSRSYQDESLLLPVERRSSQLSMDVKSEEDGTSKRASISVSGSIDRERGISEAKVGQPADPTKAKEILGKFVENPLGCKRIIFRNDVILNQYICHLTRKPIRFIVRLKVPGVSLPETLFYEKNAIEKWLELHKDDKQPPPLPGYKHSVDLSKVIVVSDEARQGSIDDRLERLATKYRQKLAQS